MEDKIVITGWGSLNAAGKTVEETWQAIKEGKSGIEKITEWDTSDWEYNLAAAIKNYEPRSLVSDRKLLKMLSRHDVIGLNAVEQAIQHSGLLSYRNTLNDPTEFNESIGVYVASPGSKFHQQYDFFPLLTKSQGNLQQFGTELSSTVNPMWLLKTLPNNVLAYTGIQYGFKGANQNIVNHSVGGTQAIHEAAKALRRGVIKRAVVAGYDTMLEPQFQTYYTALGVVSKTGVKPFDAERDGTILGEGSGALILETFSAAKERGATIYGEILGGATASEGVGIFPLQEDGAGLTRVIAETLDQTKLNVRDVGMITAHGNGTISSDAIEAKVYHALFKNTALPVTGFKWAIGHTFAGAGIIETILSLLSLQEKIAPGIASLSSVGDDCQSIGVQNTAQSILQPIALIINRGFGSLSSCIAITNQV